MLLKGESQGAAFQFIATRDSPNFRGSIFKDSNPREDFKSQSNSKAPERYALKLRNTPPYLKDTKVSLSSTILSKSFIIFLSASCRNKNLYVALPMADKKTFKEVVVQGSSKDQTTNESPASNVNIFSETPQMNASSPTPL